MMESVEQRRVRTHLSRVERALRVHASAPGAEKLRAARVRHLDRLNVYWRTGRFPKNHDAPHPVPVFIDGDGALCAVADLLIHDGHEGLARAIATRMKNFYLRDMVDHDLARWIAHSGLTLDELAWIQPSYSAEWRECREPCVEVCVEAGPDHYEWDGRSLRAIAARQGPRQSAPPNRVWKSKTGVTWGSRPGSLSRFSGDDWEHVADLPAQAASGAWTSDGEDVLAFGKEVVRLSPRGPISIEDSAAPKAATAGSGWTGAWGIDGETWVVGGTTALHIRKGVPARVAFPPITGVKWVYGGSVEFPMADVTGTGPDDVWFIGWAPGPMHWDGTSLATFEWPMRWGNIPHATIQISAVWTQAPSDAWFGGNDLLGHWKDGVFTSYDLDGGQRGVWIRGMAGSSPDDVWAVGIRNAHGLYPGPKSGLALHWNGNAWRSFDVGDVELDVVHEAARGTVWLEPSGAGCKKHAPDRSCLARKAAACKASGLSNANSTSESGEKSHPRDPAPLASIPLPLQRVTTEAPAPAARSEVAREAPAANAVPESKNLDRTSLTPSAFRWQGAAAAVASLVALGAAWLLRRRGRPR